MLTTPTPLKVALMSCAHTHAVGYASQLQASW